MIRRLAAEAIGTSMLVLIVVGSGIMAERLAGGSDALALLANAIATGCGLVVLITIFAPLSGAHFNPVVSLALAVQREMPARDALAYACVQFGAGLCGVAVANGLFGLIPLHAATKVRDGGLLFASEVLATFGLLLVIGLAHRRFEHRVPALVGAYITAAYWFTPSTSFANPAVTLARSFTDTFTGIRLADAASFGAAQLVGAIAGLKAARWLASGTDAQAPRER